MPKDFHTEPLPIPEEDAYLAYLRLEKRLSPETLSAYLSDLRLFFRNAEGKKTSGARDIGVGLEALTLPRMRIFIRSLIDLGFAPASISRYLSTLKSYCNFLADEGL